MSEAAQPREATVNPLRLWPAVVILAVLWAAVTLPFQYLTLGRLMILCLMFGVFGSQVAYALWWLLFSRVPWRDRLAGLLLAGAGLFVGVAFTFDSSAYTSMAMPIVFFPAALTAVTVAFLITKPISWRSARWVGALCWVASLAVWSCLRVDGADGSLETEFSWRWSTTAEEEFLAERARQGAAEQEAAPIVETVQLSGGDWPRFRGPGSDSRLVGFTVPTDWDKRPPRELWRRRVGPGWSSFAVVGDLLYTQEQRGESECVVCYHTEDGRELWSTEAQERFYAVESGAGPLATPSFYEGSVYAAGATGVVQRIDAASGEAAWRRSLTEDLPRKEPHQWGFSSSPLVVSAGEAALAVVYAGNPMPNADKEVSTDKAVIAYSAESGEPVWTAGEGDHTYCSPMLAELSDVQQVLVGSNAGLESLDPATGERLWLYDWNSGEYPRIAQPILINDNTIVLPTGYGLGAHGVRVTLEEGAWRTETLWKTRRLKPYFNDCVAYQGHVYGFDDKYFTCLNGETGEMTWAKRTRRQTKYGCGQVLLLEDQGVLLVITELTGELVLLQANPEKPVELARLKVLEGKTWNHPVIAHGRLYVRNSAEMACYELPAVEVAAR